ncbi:M48 family metalloprotease [Nocardioides hungaricus]
MTVLLLAAMASSVAGLTAASRGRLPRALPCSAVLVHWMALLALPFAVLSAVVVLSAHRNVPGRSLGVAALAVAGLACLVVLAEFVRANDRARRERRRHADLVGLIATQEASVLVVPHERRFAYSVPQWRGGQVVVSAGVRTTLPATLQQAILAHERKHLSARHHLLLQATAALARRTRLAWAHGVDARSRELVELNADCAGRRSTDRETMAAAIEALTAGVADRRVAFARSERARCGHLTTLATAIVAMLLVLVPTVALMSARLLGDCPFL